MKQTLILGILAVLLIGQCTSNSNKTPVVISSQKDTSSIIKEIDTMFVSDAEDWIESGKVIYRRNCAACHSFTRDLAGPKLSTRIGFGKMYNIIEDINILEKEKDKYTLSLLKEWDTKAPRMMAFNKILSEKEIRMLISYLKYQIPRHTL